jgi:DNA-binding transcriptional LysR family regulator
MVPTPAALALAGEVHLVLEQIQGLVQRRGAFDPATARRVYRLTMSDYPQLLLCAPLLGRIVDAAPHVRVDVLPWSLSFPEALESGALDFAVSPPATRVPGLQSVELLTDVNVVVVRRDHPTIKGRLTLPQFAALTHVQAAPNGREGSLLDDLLQAAGHARRVVVRVPNATILPALVASSDCCATIPSRLAAAAAKQWGLRVFPLPLEMPGISLHLTWHERATHDPGAAWLRAQIEAIAAIQPGPKPSTTAVIDLRRRAPRTL